MPPKEPMLMIRPLVFMQMRIRRLGHEERTARIGLEHVVPLRQRDRLQHRGLEDSRIVDQDIQPAEFRYHRCDRRGNALQVAHVALDSHGPHFELLEFFHGGLRFSGQNLDR